MAKYMNINPYTSKRGKPALSFQVSIKDVASLPEPDSRMRHALENLSTWRNRQNEYLPAWAGKAEALKMLHETPFPASIKSQANKASRLLIGAFEDIAKLHIEHDLTSGRIDRRKFSAIAQATAAGNYNPDVIRPYKRTVSSPSKKPHIAIVASAAWAQLHADHTYVPRITALSLGIMWACEAAGLETSAALVQGASNPMTKDEATFALMLAQPGQTVPLKAHMIGLQSNLFNASIASIRAADYEGDDQIARLWGLHTGPQYLGTGFRSHNGGNAVHWARNFMKADLVIAIGSIEDSAQADISLGYFELEQAVKEIAQQARKLNQQ